MSADLIVELADQAEALLGTGGVWTLRVAPDDAPDKRALLIDTHGKVLGELKRRGYDDIRATVTRIGEGELDMDEMPLAPGEYLAIGIDR